LDYDRASIRSGDSLSPRDTNPSAPNPGSPAGLVLGGIEKKQRE